MNDTAAALIIGNEILTGKVQEQNVFVMGRELFAMGVDLRRVVVCSDEIEVIAQELNGLRAKHDLVFTTGGVGPTHDDVTIHAVARAFDVPVVRAPEYQRLLEAHYGERLTDAHLRMADVPEGARLAITDEIRWPTVVMENVYVFPGVPEIFKLKFALLRSELRGRAAFISRAVYTLNDEASLAPLLDQLAARHTEVNIGSYLKWGEGHEYRTKVTVDGRDADLVQRCFDELLAGIDPAKFVRRE